jgi:K+-sensing histidine kinase KdpD
LAVHTAVTSALAFNFFFNELRTFRIHSPADIVTVILLFAVALVVSRLAARMREQRGGLQPSTAQRHRRPFRPAAQLRRRAADWRLAAASWPGC